MADLTVTFDRDGTAKVEVEATTIGVGDILRDTTQDVGSIRGNVGSALRTGLEGLVESLAERTSLEGFAKEYNEKLEDFKSNPSSENQAALDRSKFELEAYAAAVKGSVGIGGGFVDSMQADLAKRAIDELRNDVNSTDLNGEQKASYTQAILDWISEHRAGVLNPSTLAEAQGAISVESIADRPVEIRCFAGGTQISLKFGKSLPIERLSAFDEVACFDIGDTCGRGALKTRKIVRVYENVTDCFIRLDFADNREPLNVTPGHLMLDETGGFTKIGDLLKLGGGTVRLVDEDGSVVSATGSWLYFSAETAHMFECASTKATVVNGNVIYKEDVQEGWKTYNFEVDELHTYVAGGVRVHNDSGLLGRVGNDIDAGLDALFGGQDGDGTVRDALTDIVTAPLHVAGNILGGIASAGSALANGLNAAGQRLVEGDIIGAVAEVGRGIGNAIGEIAEGIGNAIGAVGEAIGNAVNAVGEAISGFVNNITGGNDSNDNSGSDSGKPIILDLDGDGVEVNISGNVSFDMDGDGFLERTAWADADDGFLVIDLNADGTRGTGDGVINQTSELVLTEWLDWDGATDLQALATFDQWAFRGGNNDGVLSQLDGGWSELKVWQDLNQNGISEAGELRTLDEIGISQINLTYDDGTEFSDVSNDINIFGNALLGSASYTRNGEVVVGGVGDVALDYSAEGWRRVETDLGYDIQFENGESVRIGDVSGNASAHLDLTASNLDGAIGDDRDNELRAIGYIASVQISGGDGDDLIRGGWADDFLSGDAGADNINAGEGDDIIVFDADDWIHGAGGWDTAISTEYNIFDADGVQTYAARRIDLNLQNHEIESYRGGDGVDNVWVAAGYTSSVNVSLGDGNDTATGGVADDVLSGDGGDDLLTGNRGNDVLSGGELQDTLNGGDGDDLLLGDRGDDSLRGGDGDDRAHGGDGADTLDGGQGDDSLYGSDGDDSLFGGTDGDDLLDGGNGNDSLDGGIGDDFIIGGEGNDTLTAAHGDDFLDGGLGNDVFGLGTGDNEAWGGDGDDRFWAIDVHGANVIQGGVGFDTIVLQGNQSDYLIVNSGVVASLWHIRSSSTGNSPINIVFQDIEQVQFGNGQTLAVNGADVSADTSATFVDFVSSDPQARHDAYGDLSTLPSWMFIGGNAWEGNFHTGDDTVFGTGSAADINLGSGDDYASTGIGNDSVLGDTGDDSISGGEGADILNGQTGSDEIYGGTQNDQLHGGSGSDLLNGGDQEDLLRGGSGSDVLLGGNGFDTVYGGDGADIIYGGAQADNLYGEGGSDLLQGEHGADRLFGGDGSDELIGGDANDVLWGEVGNDVLRGGNDNDRLYGQNGSDRLFGDNGHDTLDGGFGNDWLYGGALADNLEGGEGDDYLFGDDGADVLHGGNGTDYLEGGSGADVINGGSFPTDVASYVTSDSAVAVNLTAGTASGGHATGDTLISIEALQGSDHNDTLIGEGSANILDGGLGDDSLVGYGGNDRLFGQGGSDTLRGDAHNDNLYGGADNDHLFGGGDNDALFGGTGDDIVSGDGGFDTISGGAGDDSLTGGGNWDVFEFSDGFGNDTITDFDVTNSFEHIDLSGVSGVGSFSDLTISAAGANTIIDFGDGNTITLIGVSDGSLTANEFVF